MSRFRHSWLSCIRRSDRVRLDRNRDLCLLRGSTSIRPNLQIHLVVLEFDIGVDLRLMIFDLEFLCDRSMYLMLQHRNV